jgi:hypothetical protein
VAAKRVAQVDFLTELPLPPYPFSDPPITEDRLGLNWHHHFHPRAKLLEMDRSKDVEHGGVFLRHSRVQLLPCWIHDEYHAIYSGPPIEQDLKKRFLLGVFAVAGYMPRTAIDVTQSRDSNATVRLSDEEYRKITAPQVLKGEIVGRRTRLMRAGKFMMDVMMSQVDEGVQAIDYLTIEEFLTTKDKNTRIQLGSKILETLIEISTEPIESKYRSAYKQHRLINEELDSPKLVVVAATEPFVDNHLGRLKKQVSKAVAA